MDGAASFFPKPENGTLAAPAAAAVSVIPADGETFDGGGGGGGENR